MALAVESGACGAGGKVKLTGADIVVNHHQQEKKRS